MSIKTINIERTRQYNFFIYNPGPRGAACVEQPLVERLAWSSPPWCATSMTSMERPSWSAPAWSGPRGAPLPSSPPPTRVELPTYMEYAYNPLYQISAVTPIPPLATDPRTMIRSLVTNNVVEWFAETVI